MVFTHILIRPFKLLLSLMIILLPIRTSGQAYNFVKEITCFDEYGNNTVTVSQYYDGLGRKTLKATNGINTIGRWAYTLTQYDKKGRVCSEWLPALGIFSEDGSVGDNGAYSQLSNDTYNESGSFGSYTYDALDRVTSITDAGQAWHSAQKGIVKEFGANASGHVKKYTANESGSSLSLSGYYAAGTLTWEQSEDEDGRKTRIYKDFLGRKVLERQLGSADTLDTYYVYNGRNLLCYVLTPEYQKHGYKSSYAYKYCYDEYSRLENKKIPCCAPTHYYYDTEGRVVYSLEATNGYKFYFYDDNGRQVIKGSCSNFNYHNYKNVTMSSSGDGLLGTGYFYSYPSSLTKPVLDVVTFYDNYLFLDKSVFTSSPYNSSLRKPSHANATGLQTGSIVRTSANKYLLTVLYYDEMGRIIEKRETLSDGGLRTTATTYSFTDKPLTETVSLLKGGTTTTIHKKYSYYDANDNLQSIAIAYNGGDTVCIAEYQYNQLGQLERLKRGGNAGDVCYNYNVRGWITEINGRGFKEWLHYNDGLGVARYNGNISSQLWKADNENFKRGYTFSYDSFNRMTRAGYGEGDDLSEHTDRYTEWIKEYTQNGGLQKIERYGRKSDGKYGKIDNLRLYYDGIRVDSVKEDALPVTSAGAFDFKSSTVSGLYGKQYSYRPDGSLLWDSNKGIALIDYNSFGSPVRVQFTNGNTTEYEYSATGERLRTVYRTAVPNLTVPLGSSTLLDATNTLAVDSVNYVGEFVFENGVLSKYLFEGGYMTFPNGQPHYHYFSKDHLGNNRAVVNESGTIEQITHYYPFGAVYANAGLGDAVQRFKYNGKELDRMHGLNQYDYGARNYDPLLCRFIQIDPNAEDYYGYSPYAYCLNNPINAIDPDGRSTWVISLEDGTYQVIGGDINDGDRNIYVYSQDDNGKYIKQEESIGITATMTSFYNSDEDNPKNRWSGIIDPKDNSGKQFLNTIMGNNSPNIIKYMYYARNKKKYDFKETNGSDSPIYGISHYRGMPISDSTEGGVTFASARDIGNMAAGYIAAKNGISWSAARKAFDLYQGCPEGRSTVSAELYGYTVLGYNTFAQKLLRLQRK